jgi:hypothetical protein
MSYSNRAVAPAAPDETSPDNAGMREALGDLTILPAPTNVDDLVARLEQEGVAYASGPLATIISDARVPDLEPTLLTVWEDNEMSDDTFFVSIPMANSNHPRRLRPLAPRVLGLLFGGGLTIGTLLICWNALVSADLLADPPGPPAASLSDVASPGMLPPAAPVASQDPGTAWAALEPARPIEEMAQPADTPAVASSASPQPASSPAPEAVPETAEARADTALAQLADVIAESAPVTLPEPVATPVASPVDSDQAPAPQSAPLQTADLDANGAITQPEATPQPAPLPETNAVAVPVAAEAPAALPAAVPQATLQPSAAATEPPPSTGETTTDAAVAETGATESLPPPTTPEPEFTGLAERVAAVVAPRDLPTGGHATPPPQRTTAAAKPRAGAKASSRVPFAGAWATSAEACTPQGQQEGHLVTHINARRARAGDTSCTFRKMRRNGNLWDVTATCSDGETRWASDVQLSVSRNSLTWTSQKGTTDYVRCRRG